MNKRIFLPKLYILIWILFIFFMPFCGFAKGEPNIRVGILIRISSFTISSPTGFSVYDSHGLVLDTKDSYTVQFNSGGKGVSFLSFGSNWIKVVPHEGLLKVNKRIYRGYIEVYPSSQGGLDVVNILPLEAYLKGVIRMEISEKWPIDAIKAQAIIARTFALYNWNKHIKEGFNLCATTHCQLYGGVTHESPITNKAVDDTRGFILVYKGKPIDSVYHSASGGYTEDSEYVWGKYIPYLRGVKSNFEHPTKDINWTFAIDSDTLRRKLYSWYKKDIGDVYDIKIDTLSPHGRIYKLTVIGTMGTIKMKGTDFRFLLGVRNLKSTMFTIEKVRRKKKITVIEKIDEEPSLTEKFQQKEDWTLEELVTLLKEDMNQEEKETKIVKKEIEVDSNKTFFLFKGKGLGHGVGLSQWGAKALAEMGYNYKDILKYYYHNVKLIRLYK